MKNQIDYNQVVNISEDNEITVLNHVFVHSDSFKGATGNKFYPVSKSYLEERIDDESLEDYIDSGDLTYKQGKDIMNMDREKRIEFMFDLSYKNLWDYLRTFGFPEEEYPIFECVDGGRCFSADFQGNVNPELSKIIREYETK